MNYDSLIIGFGKGGKTLAKKLKSMGENVALIEKDAAMYGGTCINVGCIPSKKLINAAAKAPIGDFAIKQDYYKKSVLAKNDLIKALRQKITKCLLMQGCSL